MKALSCFVVTLLCSFTLHAKPAATPQCVGVWYLTWEDSSVVPQACNMGFAFSGWANVENTLLDSSLVFDRLPGERYLTIGGGNHNGAYTAEVLDRLSEAIAEGKLSAYKGIAYDVEEGDSGLVDAMAASFQIAKDYGFEVVVTVSHSAPYGIEDAYPLMEMIVANPNVDYLSPQLYISGNEPGNDYSITANVPWEMYLRSQAKIIPSIGNEGYYQDAVRFFEAKGISLSGYILWGKRK